YSTKRVQIVAIVREVANVDRVALTSFDRGRDILAAHPGADRPLNVSDRQAIPRCDGAVDVNVDVEPLRDPLGENSPRARDGSQDLFNLIANLLNPVDVGALNLESDRSFDSRQLHVEPVL